MKDYKEVNTKYLEELARLESGGDVEKFILVIELDGRDAVQMRLLLSACDEGKEREVARSVLRMGIARATRGLAGAMIEEVLKGVVRKNKEESDGL